MTLLECPFHHLDEKMNTVECGHKSLTDMGYLAHTKKHKPVVLEEEERLWQLRLKMAKNYAALKENPAMKKTPVGYATYMWWRKPKNMDCGAYTAMLQDEGILDQDNFAGLAAANAGETGLPKEVKEKA